jgi:hypothetical protein
MATDFEVWLAAYCASIAGTASEARTADDLKLFAVRASEGAYNAVYHAKGARLNLENIGDPNHGPSDGQ